MNSPKIYLIECPQCGNGRVYRSRTQWPEKILKLFRRRPYRCYDCGHRFIGSVGPHLVVDGADLVSQKIQAHCPNCEKPQNLVLTGAEVDLLNEEGWLVSCPGCRATYVTRT